MLYYSKFNPWVSFSSGAVDFAFHDRASATCLDGSEEVILKYGMDLFGLFIVCFVLQTNIFKHLAQMLKTCGQWGEGELIKWATIFL